MKFLGWTFSQWAIAAARFPGQKTTMAGLLELRRMWMTAYRGEPRGSRKRDVGFATLVIEMAVTERAV